MRSFNACLLCLCLGASSRAAAQPSAPPTPRNPTLSPTPSAPSDGARDTGVDASRSGVPDVNDPMLEPIELPTQVLASWRQALSLIQGRSTSIATARARIVEANA